MTTILTADDRAVWQCDVDECEDCQAAPGEEVCSEHDLDDPEVASRYAGAGEDDEEETTSYAVRVIDGNASAGGVAWDVDAITPIEADSSAEALDLLEDWARGEAAGISDYDDGGTLTLIVDLPDGTLDQRLITLEAE